MLKLLSLLIQTDLLLAYRQRSEWLNAVLFFVMVVVLFPFAVDPDTRLLQLIGPGIIWVAALLAILMSLDNLFRTDFDDGFLEQLRLSPYPVSLLVFSKIIAHWLVSCVPLLVITPLLGVFLHLSLTSIGMLLLSLLIGTPILCFIGSVGMALTLGLRNSSLLLSLIILPLYIPVLIFGAGSVVAAGLGLPFLGQLILLVAMLLMAMCLAPFATAGALNIANH